MGNRKLVLGTGISLILAFALSGQTRTSTRVQSEPRLSKGPSRPVEIPALAWNTFFEMSNGNFGEAMAVDGSGNIYVTGYARSTWGNPVRPYSGDSDAFVAKLDSNGALLWNTFLGGEGYDAGNEIAVDGAGNVYITGISYSSWGGSTCPEPDGTHAPVFSAKLDSNGLLQWNRFLFWITGAYFWGSGAAVDAQGHVYVRGTSHKLSDLPGWGLFVAKLDSNGLFHWDNRLFEARTLKIAKIAANGLGNVYLTGTGGGWKNPIRRWSGKGDACVAKLDANGELLWHTLLGGEGDDSGYQIAVDSSGNVAVTGMSEASWGDPIRPFSGQTDAFAAKLDANGILQWNTFLGGIEADADHEYGQNIAWDGSGNIYVAGHSRSIWGNPIGFNAKEVLGAFAAKLDSSGALKWNVFLGGGKDDVADGVAVDRSGDLYVVGYSDSTWGSPIAPFSGFGNTFLTKIVARAHKLDSRQLEKERDSHIYDPHIIKSRTVVR
jgi:hypothetical protein